MSFQLLVLLVGIVAGTARVGAQWCDRPDNVTCVEPPYTLVDVFSFQNRAILNILGFSAGGRTVYVAGGSGGIERQLFRSDDGGVSFVEDVAAEGLPKALGYAADGDVLLTGSLWSWPDDGGKNTSYAQSREGGAGEDVWVPAPMDGFDGDVRSVFVHEKGISYLNGVFYMAAQIKYDIFHQPWTEFYLVKTDGRQYEWFRMPGEDEYPVTRVVFTDERNGIAIAGQHWYSEEADPHHMALIFVTSDGGLTWTETWNVYDEYTFVDLECAGSTCWVAAMGLGDLADDNIGIIMVTHDLGFTWETQFRTLNDDPSDAYVHFVDLHFVDENVGFAAGNNFANLVVMVTTNGGANWDFAYEPGKFSDWRHVVHEMYDVDGVCHLLVQEPEGVKSQVIRLEPPSRH